MKNKIKHLLFLSVILFSIASCIDDKGNYDYTEIEDAIIEIPEVKENGGKISRDRYAELSFNPEIQYQAGSSVDDYNFEWSLYTQQPQKDDDDTYFPKKVIGDQPQLSYKLIDEPDKYYVVLKVTHKEMGSCTDYKFELNINSMVGWLIYDEVASGEGDFQIIRDREIVPELSSIQTGIVRNYFATANGGKKLQDGKFLGRRNMNNRYDHLYLFKEDGMYKMKAGTYEVITEDYSTLFSTQPAKNAPMALYYPSPMYGQVEVFVNNNEMYTIRWNMLGQEDKYTTPIGAFGTAYKVNPFIAPVPVTGNTVRAVLYNDISNAKGQFITINSSGAAGFPRTPEGKFNTGAINTNETMRLKLEYLGQGRDGITCALFKDELNEGKLSLYTVDLRDVSKPLALEIYDLGDLQNIDDAKYFTFGTRGDVLFYAATSKVYSYVFNGTVTELLSTPGEEIVSMKLYTHSANEDYSGRMLFVATYDGSAGKVYKIKFNELNGQLDGEIEEYTGFGRIIDMMNKE